MFEELHIRKNKFENSKLINAKTTAKILTRVVQDEENTSILHNLLYYKV